jgi:N-acetylmuramoyl-L-alanine amidase
VLEKHGVAVKMSRTKDENDPLSEEIRECNAFGPDLAVSIHNNAGGGDGAEVFHHHGGGKGKALAENILAEIVKVGQNSRGAKVRKNASGKDYYGFIRETSCPAVIVECAFVDNATDLQILSTEDKRKAMGVAIAKGILKSLGVEFQAEKGYWKVQVGAYLYRENAVDMQKKIKAVGFDAFIVKE